MSQMTSEQLDRRFTSPTMPNYINCGSSRERSRNRGKSPHLLQDRITRYASPSPCRQTQSPEQVTPRVSQMYRTSFSAVTSPQKKKSPGYGRIPVNSRTRSVSPDRRNRIDRDYTNSHEYITNIVNAQRCRASDRSRSVGPERNSRIASINVNSVKSQGANMRSPLTSMENSSPRNQNGIHEKTHVQFSNKANSSETCEPYFVESEILPKEKEVKSVINRVYVHDVNLHYENVDGLKSPKSPVTEALVKEMVERKRTQGGRPPPSPNGGKSKKGSSPSGSESSLRKISSGISSFIRKMSPNMPRKADKNNQKRGHSLDSDESASVESVPTPTGTRTSRAKSPKTRQSPIRRFFSRSRSRDSDAMSHASTTDSDPYSDASGKAISPSQLSHISTAESPKSSSSFSPSANLMMKSLEQNTNNKSVYHAFKSKQSSPKHNVDVPNSFKAALKATSLTQPAGSRDDLQDVAANTKPGSLDVSDPTVIMRTPESIGECSLDVKSPGSEPSVASDSSKKMILSQDMHNGGSNSPKQNGTTITTYTDTTPAKLPSYVKLSCAVSGYNKYNSYASLTLSNSANQDSPPSSKITELRTLSNGSTGGSPKCTDNLHVDPHRTSELSNNVNRNNEPDVDGDDTFTTGASLDRDIQTEELPQRTPSLDFLSERLKNLGDSSSVKDGTYFLDLVQHEREKLLGLSSRIEQDLTTDIPEEACGKIRAAIGKTNLLTTKKFVQFEGLCQKNLHAPKDDPFPTTCEDLAGFWDMVSLQVEDILWDIQEIEAMRKNNWKEISRKIRRSSSGASDTQKPVASKQTPVKPGKLDSKSTSKSAKAKEAQKIRQEARKRLMAAKREGMRKRTRSGGDEQEIEIYIAEPVTSPSPMS
ncbi:unnamed protein product [Owenia fusiformis]|uniref:Uncharacterized protein n=1 Tax=Owenia fusiformis TaxID=6347 RepID=A0A8J1XQK0_OWEFU|nr:unnamed protein product [Owenia fusiformis]